MAYLTDPLRIEGENADVLKAKDARSGTTTLILGNSKFETQKIENYGDCVLLLWVSTYSTFELTRFVKIRF